MPPDLNLDFADQALVLTILEDPDFISDGYRWGHDGHVWYCFLNPRLWRFEIWRSWFGLGWLSTILIPILGQLLIAFNLFVLPRHYSASARRQKAPVVTNGPRMRRRRLLRWAMILAIFLAPIGVAFVALDVITRPTVTFAGISLPLPPTAVAVGVIVGFNLACRLIYYSGVRLSPGGDIVGTTFVDAGRIFPGTYHLGRAPHEQEISSYQVAPDRPRGLQPACGGLAPIIVAGQPGSALGGKAASLYNRLMRRRGRLVVWALAHWDLEESPDLAQAIQRHHVRYREFAPVEGLLIVAGSTSWAASDTQSLLTHRVLDAVAVDSGSAALLGRQGQLLMTPGILRDKTQRYGFRVT